MGKRSVLRARILQHCKRPQRGLTSMLLSAKSIHVQSVLSHLVVEDAFGGAQQPRCFCPVSARRLESIEYEIALVSGNGFAQGKTRKRARSLRGLQRRGKMMPVDNRAVTDQNGALDDIFELADVAGPVIGRQHIDGRRGNAADVSTVLLRILLKEVVRQQKQVRLTFS